MKIVIAFALASLSTLSALTIAPVTGNDMDTVSIDDR